VWLLLQPLVAADIAQQMGARDGSEINIFGVMIESHIVAGRQELTRANFLANSVCIVVVHVRVRVYRRYSRAVV
jgi:phospho-2-dehydro-3-deoxyheptonate aldolase